MLDAANNRLAAVTRQQRESRDDDATTASLEDRIPIFVVSSPPVVDSGGPTTTPQALSAVKTGSAKSPDSGKHGAPPPQRPAAPPAQQKEKGPESPVHAQTAAADLPPAAPVSIPTPEAGAPLAISELRLCRNVSGFASFEPLNETSVKAGQQILIYCEMTGLRYEAKDAGFVSRISSRIDIRPAGGGPIQWEHELGAADDVCRRRRHDYYVNYFVQLPRTLTPGSYTLRLTQTDLIANRSTTAEIPLAIKP